MIEKLSFGEQDFLWALHTLCGKCHWFLKIQLEGSWQTALNSNHAECRQPIVWLWYSKVNFQQWK